MATTQNPMNKWRLDLLSSGSRALIKSAASDQSLNPPGFHPGGFVQSQQVHINYYNKMYNVIITKVEASSKNEQQQQHLLGKRAWDIALGPMKALPMNMLVINTW